MHHLWYNFFFFSSRRRHTRFDCDWSSDVCHTVKGTPAAGKVGPELTHIASKPNIGGVLSPVNQENLVKWISDAPSIKPGIVMPRFKGVLTDQQINDIAQWLLTLK